MNVNIEIQYDTEQEGGHSEPLTFQQIKQIGADVNAPAYATIDFHEEEYGWTIRIHWNTDMRTR